MDDVPLICPLCAERIGVYEPLWWRRPDGRGAATSLLRAREHPSFAEPGSTYFHQDCYERDARGRGQSPTSPWSSA
jgi:hypothetical protein